MAGIPWYHDTLMEHLGRYHQVRLPKLAGTGVAGYALVDRASTRASSLLVSNELGP